MSAPIFSNHGCRLNAYETEAMKELAEQAGLKDAVIVNTCAVTAEAVRKARQDIRKLRKANPDARLIVTGCAAQTEPETFTKMAEVDAVIGNTEKMVGATWQGLAADFIGETEALQVDDIMSVTETAGHLIDGFGTRSRAYVQVQNGCDHRCTFCIIPYGRGNSRSVPAGVVVDQIKRLVGGFKRQIVNLLPRKGKTDRQGRPPHTQLFQRAVIKPAAIPQTPASAVERQQGHNHDFRVKEILGSGDPSAKSTVHQRGIRGPARKPQRLRRAHDHRHAHGAMGRRLGHGGARVNLCAYG